MTVKEIVLSCFTVHRGKTIGFLCGLTFGILVLTLGFWRGLFLGLAIGFYDRKENFLAFLDKILPEGIRNKMQ